MKKRQNRTLPISHKAKLIYNPAAGKKRRLIRGAVETTLEGIEELFLQYQIPVDFVPTKYPGHATILARDSIKEGYHLVIAAGGDGTVGEVANGLIESNVPLGILPLGSFMNTAKMLSIPNDLEKAVQLIKICRTRKIDVGCITKLGGEKIQEPMIFLEVAGMGLEAQIHEHILEWERGHWKALINLFKTLFDYYGHRAKIVLDKKKTIETRATLVNISNGPYSGAAIPFAPTARLNDHRLTLTLFKMSKIELFKYFYKIIRTGKSYSRKIETYKARQIKIYTRTPRMVHADARVFGTTPVEFRIIPNALNVITGFPKPNEKNALRKRTLLDP